MSCPGTPSALASFFLHTASYVGGELYLVVIAGSQQPIVASFTGIAENLHCRAGGLVLIGTTLSGRTGCLRRNWSRVAFASTRYLEKRSLLHANAGARSAGCTVPAWTSGGPLARTVPFQSAQSVYFSTISYLDSRIAKLRGEGGASTTAYS